MPPPLLVIPAEAILCRSAICSIFVVLASFFMNLSFDIAFPIEGCAFVRERISIII